MKVAKKHKNGNHLVADTRLSTRLQSTVIIERLHSSSLYADASIVMAALCNREGHYILPCGFYLSFFSIFFSFLA